MNAQTTALTNLNTDSRNIPQLLKLEKITLKDIEHLDKPARQRLGLAINKKLAHLSGTERDTFLEKIEQITPAISKSDVWEYNHMVISNAISNLMHKYGNMPTKNDIANETGLSRQTVSKHLIEYRSTPEFIAQMEQFKFMAPKVLANIYKLASNGDIRAARLYLEMVGAINKPGNAVGNGQNNYIQINNTILSQQNLKQLTSEQLTQIENIIKRQAGTHLTVPAQ